MPNYLLYSIPIIFLIYYLLFKILAYKINLIDYPDTDKKRHYGNVPLIGGPVIYLTLFTLVFLYDFEYFYTYLILASGIIIVLGFIDDISPVRIEIRVFFQIIASLIVFFLGYSVISLGIYEFFGEIKLGYLSLFFTIICVLLITNSSNFIDGIDGLCASVSIVNLIILNLLVFYLCNCFFINFTSIYILILFIFLIFNITSNIKLKIFLGDSGSTFVGFSFAWILVFYSMKFNDILHPILIAWCVPFLTFEFIDLVLYRILNKRNLFKYDRNHIHYILNDIGLNTTQTLIILLFVSSIISMIGIVFAVLISPLISLLFFLLISICYLLTKYYLRKHVKF